jgi:ketosteroid isomerase-like protein
MGIDDVTRAGSEARAAFAEALRRGDASAAGSLYTRDARMLAPAAPPIRGRDEIERYWQTGVDAGVRDVALELVSIDSHDRVAYELGRYALALDSEDGEVVDRGDYLLVHERQDDGSWRWAVEMFKSDAPTVRPDEGRGS